MMSPLKFSVGSTLLLLLCWACVTRLGWLAGLVVYELVALLLLVVVGWSEGWWDKPPGGQT